jgi:DNA-binding transcriptional MerR regulator
MKKVMYVLLSGGNVMERETYTAEELSHKIGCHRGTIRNYVWRGILPKPIGKGRAARYDNRHLNIMMMIKHEREKRMTMRDWADWHKAQSHA